MRWIYRQRPICCAFVAVRRVELVNGSSHRAVGLVNGFGDELPNLQAHHGAVRLPPQPTLDMELRVQVA